ncbi:hypothetical protein SAMN05444722_3109 [Rhodovulum sp. ES.010]|nr:hypothetical protein SAMN05444722_3109 [Rhodovulum sp. ES.010]
MKHHSNKVLAIIKFGQDGFNLFRRQLFSLCKII